MIITLPLPPKQLSPNARCHWAVKAKKVKWYRQTAGYAALTDCPEVVTQDPMETATVQCRFFFKEDRRRDGDNLLASMKAAWDGLVDAGLFVDDSGLTHLPVVQEKDPKNPRVEIHITEGEGNER